MPAEALAKAGSARRGSSHSARRSGFAKKSTVLIAGVLLLCAVPATAADKAVVADVSIVALVNDEIISSLDVQSRLRLILATTQLSDTPEIRERLAPQVLRSLMDEKLQLQEAVRHGIAISEADIDEALRTIEMQRGMPAGMLTGRLESVGVPGATLRDQIRAQLAWSKLVLKAVRPRVKISEEEVERERSKVRKAGGEVQIEMLSLPVDHPESERQVEALAEKLVSEMRAGTSFESVARELRGAASSQEADAFWVPLDQLETSIASALKDAAPGTLLDPIRTLEGYTLIKLLGRRAQHGTGSVTEVVLKDILLTLKQEAEPKDANLMLEVGREVAKHPGTCSEEGVAGLRSLEGLDIAATFRRETLETLPEALRRILEGIRVGGVSEPVATNEGIRLFMLCERVEKPGPLGDREEAAQRLYQQKLELEAQKYLRHLRREATVDVRRQE